MRTFQDIDTAILTAHHALKKAGIHGQSLLFELSPEEFRRFKAGVDIGKITLSARFRREEIVYFGQHIVRECLT